MLSFNILIDSNRQAQFFRSNLMSTITIGIRFKYLKQQSFIILKGGAAINN